MKRVVVLAVLGVTWAAGAGGQTLPAPQFATPAVGDSSSHAATTGWVRSQNLLSSTGDLSQATVRPTGAPIARSQAVRAAEMFNVLDWGAVADGVTDIGPALNAIAAAMGSAARSNVIYFPAGSYRIATPVTFNGIAPILQGQGFAQGPFQTGWTGTWIKIDSAGTTPITFSGTNARGAKVRDLAFYEIHPVPAAGWAPNSNDYVFRVLNALGEVAFDNVLFAGVNRGIYADNSGRLAIKDVQGQFYTAGVEIDDCYDVPRIDRLHSWTFANSSPFVVAYQEAHADTVLLRRVDGIFIGDLFTLGMYSAVHLSSGINGVTTKAYISNLYADFVNHGVVIDGAGSDLQIANMTSQNNDQTNSGATLPGGHAVWVNTTGVTAQIGNLYSKLTAGPAVEVDGNSNRVNIANLRANTYGAAGAGTAAVFVADSGSNASNQVYVGNKEQLQGTAPLVLFNSGSNGGRQRFVMMNDVGGANQNEARAYSAAPGSAPQLAAIGGDPNIDLYLNGKGTSGVRLQSSGQTVLRADNANGVADDVLLRAGTGTMNLIAEGGDANIDFYLSPKGTSGGVRLQGGGSQTVLRVDNANASVDDLLVRGGIASLNLLPEGAEAAIDLYLTTKGAGSVRLQANGGTVLRVDSPGPGTSDLLVRSGGGVMALTVEDAAANANLVINPKGAGLVSVGNCPSTSDNSANLACTSWVKAWVLAQGYGSGTGGITAITGDVTASGTGSVAATLASVATPATTGDGGHVAQITVDAKGRTTTAAAVAIAFPVTTVAGRTGAVVIASTDVSGLGPLATQPALVSQTVVGTAASGLLAAAAVQGSGAKVQLATGPTTSGDCVKYDSTGNTVDGGPCSAGGITALTGDVVASGSGSVATSLVATGTAGSYTRVTTDTKGRVTAGTALGSSDVTGALGFVPLPTASPSATGSLSVVGTNSVVLAGAPSGSAATVAALGGDASVDLSLAAAGTAGTTRLLANGATVFRADNPGGGNSDLLARAGSGIVSLSIESTATAAGLALVPKGAGVVTAPTPAATDNSTTVATTAFVKSVGYAAAAAAVLTGTTTISGSNSVTLSGAASGNGPTIAAVGGDAAVDLNLSSVGAGSLRLKSNGVNVLRTDSPGPGTSDLLVRSGTGTVSFTLEDPTANASLTINPKGNGVINVPTPAQSSNGTTVATTALVRSVLPCVQPQTGRAYTSPTAALSTAAATNTSAAQSIYAMPFAMCGDKAVTAMAFEITTTTATAFSARMAIYADASGVPGGAPLTDTGTMAIAANATGMQIAAISGGPTLHPGIYWLTFQSSYLAAPATLRAASIGNPGALAQFLGFALTAGAADAVPTAIYQTGVFGAPPSPFGTPAGYVTGNSPLAWVQF